MGHSRRAISVGERNELLHENWGSLKNVVRSLVRGRTDNCVGDLEDLCGAVYLGLIRLADTYDRSRGASFVTYAYHRARGIVLDEINAARKVWAGPPEPFDSHDLGTPLASFLKREEIDLVREAIRRLPQIERFVVTRYFYDEMPLREIGGLLDVTEGRVSQIRATALGRMALILYDDFGGGAGKVVRTRNEVGRRRRVSRV